MNNYPNRKFFFFLTFGVIFAYAWGLPGAFLFDDQPNLWGNPRFVLTDHSWTSFITSIFSSISGPTSRPVSMLTFTLNQWFFGLNDPLPYKITNIIVHLINSILIFYFLRFLLSTKTNQLLKENPLCISPNKIAFLITCLWAWHPLQLTSVLYVIQRMTSLATTFSLLALIAYIQFRQLYIIKNQPTAKWVLWLFSSIFFYVLAILSKESALTLPLFFLLLEIWFFKFQEKTTRHACFESKFFWIYTLGGIIGLIGVVGLFIIAPEKILSGYSIRNFTLEERLLTEPRIIATYLSFFIWPQISQLSLHHDAFQVSTGLLNPISTLFVIGFWLGVLVFILLPKLRNSFPWLSFALAWFLVGHILESTVWPLELMHEHRNYFPSIGLAMTLGIGLTRVINYLPLRESIKHIAFYVIPCIFLMLTGIRASQWSHPLEHAMIEAYNQPASPRANYEAGRQLFAFYQFNKETQIRDLAKEKFIKATQGDRIGDEFAFVGLIYLAGEDKTAPDAEILANYAKRLRETRSTHLTTGQIENISDCQLDNKCFLSTEQFFGLIQALEQNPNSNNHIRSSLQIIRGNYFANKIGDMKNAELSFLRARELNPEHAETYIALAWLYAINHDFINAKKYLAEAEKMPDAWKFASRLKRMDNRKTELEQQTTNQ